MNLCAPISVIENAWIVPALPVAAFFVILFFGRRMPRKGHEVGVPAVFLSLLYSLVVVVQVWGKHADVLRIIADRVDAHRTNRLSKIDPQLDSA